MNVSIRKKIKWNGTHRRLKSAARIWSILGVCSTEEKSETFKARNSRNLIYFCYLFFLPCPCHLSFFFDFDSLIRLLIARALRNIKIFLSEFLAVRSSPSSWGRSAFEIAVDDVAMKDLREFFFPCAAKHILLFVSSVWCSGCESRTVTKLRWLAADHKTVFHLFENSFLTSRARRGEK